MEEKTVRIDFAKITQTALQVITSPAEFFRTMPKGGGFVEPLVFLVLMGAVAGLIQAVAAIFGIFPGAGRGPALAAVIMYPLFGAVFSFIGTAVVFIIWKGMGSHESYEAAYRCVGYLSALWPVATVLHLVPFIGPPAAIAIWTYFYIVASIEVHAIPPRKAWLVFGIIGGVFMLISIIGGVAHRMSGDGEQYRKQLERSSQEMQKNADEMKRLLDEMQKKSQQK
jgi:hypothetical protein